MAFQYWKDIINWRFTVYLPKSRRLSKKCPRFFCKSVRIWSFPGLIVSTIVNPMRIASQVVNIKYSRALNVILPLTPDCKLDDTVIILDMSNGNVINFNILKNSSPGYDISRIVSFDKWHDRRLIPANNFCYVIILGEVEKRNNTNQIQSRQWHQSR